MIVVLLNQKGGVGKTTLALHLAGEWAREFELPEDEPDDDAQRLRALQRQVRTIARQATLDPGDDMGL